mgnify:CR=1 FL=1
MTAQRFEHDHYYSYDLREPPRKIIHPDRLPMTSIHSITDDWTNIPYYPDAKTRQQMVHKYGEKETENIINKELTKQRV